MLSIEAIREESDRQARRAAREERQPYVIWDEAEVDSPDVRVRFPNIGSYIPPGWTPIEEARFFCDKFGEGGEGGDIGVEELRRRIKRVMANHPRQVVGFAIVEEGEFQLYVQGFVKDRRHTKPKPKDVDEGGPFRSAKDRAWAERELRGEV